MLSRQVRLGAYLLIKLAGGITSEPDCEERTHNALDFLGKRWSLSSQGRNRDSEGRRARIGKMEGKCVSPTKRCI
jgi:hypothetical protein